MRSPPLRLLESRGFFDRALRPLSIGLLVFVERLLCRGELYFADGPAHLQAISAHIYVIQPPGYWLFNRIAGLFANPLVAIMIMNIGFSVVGTIVFYYAARLFTIRQL